MAWLKQFNRWRRSLRYLLKYRLNRPEWPKQPLTTPALIVGSAPVSHKPPGFDDRFFVICINGSQAATEAWNIGRPDVTFLQFNQVKGKGERAVAVRNALSGKRCGTLHVIRWPESEQALRQGLAAFDYGFDDLRLIGQYHRTRLAEDVLGRIIREGDNEAKFSNGITAVLYAFHNGAPAVVITGIDPFSSGHVYNSLNKERLHTNMDVEILRELSNRGFPLFTSDPQVAESVGLRLWTGEAIVAARSA
ncbi:membrane-anchored protein [Pararhizobium sp. O133]|uniref:membrane-anchored protein n=1 Tax=Pararhizobium sp. O133 TaxID=3449278 RepID=UPI003F68439E